ncbi:uncharacterized protein LTR77_007736 [Saxophila tyrrhenica]|uniref:Uncharacterized protein n=1 Tax=Saxophila tyrrhenica TaxID=1690608 RepID=A0AAV9P698_9PEZI|nr:hypothetical protein LTR77_007736 [Saxophila tyrrhenica]
MAAPIPTQPMPDETTTIQVGDLGIFSMRAVYDALASSLQVPQRHTTLGHVERQENNTWALAPPARCDKPGFTMQQESKADDSDCSWTGEEDSGDFYVRMRRQLDDFILSPDQTTLTTDSLSRHERRFVHASAQVMHLGHASLGPPRSRNRSMVIYKTTQPTIPFVLQATEREHPRTISWAPDIDVDTQSLASASTNRKRPRLEKVTGGYPCQYCPKLFDRASERNKHAQAHQPSYTNRHICPLCQKGFRYPKDLRRHTTRVHENSATSRPIFDPTYASFGSMTLSSTLTYESRIPSETSLTFNSQPTSKNCSPSLLGQKGDVDAVEPLCLDMGDGMGLGGEFGLPFQELADFDFDGHDFGEEDGLEMMKVRK